MSANADALSVVQKMYDRMFALDWEGMKACLFDDFIIIHQGINHPDLPFYNTFYGQDGCFEWINHIFETVNLHQFDFTYFVAEGNIVHTHVREGGTVKKSGAALCIENFHYFKLNENQKICFCEIISETFPVVRALYGKPGESYKTNYEAEDISVSHYLFTNEYNKKVAKASLDFIKRGQTEQLSDVLSGDTIFIVNGDESCVPYAGKFTGKDSVVRFVQLFQPEIKDIEISYIIAENNKADVIFKLDGQSTRTGKNFMHDASLSLQFSENGKIKYLFLQMNSYEIHRAYSRE